MNTYLELNEYLSNYNDNFIKWLEEHWIGKDKQESVLRLFASLSLIDKIKLYDICTGNFNLKTITKHKSIKDIYYNEKNIPISLKDKGDSSDLTGIHKKDDKHLLVTTSKNINKMQVGELDIDKILTNFEQYKKDGYTMTLCICIRYISDFHNMIKGIEKTNQQLKLFLEKEDIIIIDWNDLNQAYHQFKMNFAGKSLDKMINSNKNILSLKMHQTLSVMKTIRMKTFEKKRILWGHIQRSGKSYIIGGTIIEDIKDKDECNYLIITTAINETEVQYHDVFNHLQFEDFNGLGLI